MNYLNHVSLELDSFILDKDQPIWIASLSDGTVAHQDDDRPGYYHNSWVRLRNHCYENNLTITNVTLKFRSHVEKVGSSEEGYFFIRAILGSLVKNVKKPPVFFYKVGLIKDGEIKIQKWRVPELLLVDRETREVNEESQLVIIWNNVKEQDRQKQIPV